MNAPDKRDAWIDAARGLAALAVAIFHFNVIVHSDGSPWSAIWRYGYLGVPVFFVLSGFCVTKSWLKSTDWRDFASRRARRILPAYYGSLVLVLGVAGVTKLIQGVNDVTVLPRSLGSVAATCALMTRPATSVPTMNWVYWSLSYEVAFYAILGAIMIGADARRRVWWLVALHALICAGAAAGIGGGPGIVFFVDCWPMFGLGALLAVAPHAAVAAAVMAGTLVVWLALTIRATSDPAALVVAGLVAMTIRAAPHVAFPRCLTALQHAGRISYSIYLVHVPIGLFVVFRFAPTGIQTPWAVASLHLVTLAAVIGFAFAFYAVCERPWLTAARRPAPPTLPPDDPAVPAPSSAQA